MEKNILFIDEKNYQQFKKDMCIKNDFLSKKQLEKIRKKIGVILA